MNGLQITLLALLGGAFLYGILGYRSHYGALSSRSRLYRTAGVALLVLLLTLGYIAASSTVAGTGKIGAIRYAALLLSCLLVALSLAGLAVLDALESFVVFRRERRTELNKLIAETVAAAERKKEPDDV